MKISDSFLLEAIEDKLESAVRYGVTRAYKHSDLQPPSDAQVDMICESVRSALYEIVECDSPEGSGT
jgi:hypothetical protein